MWGNVGNCIYLHIYNARVRAKEFRVRIVCVL